MVASHESDVLVIGTGGAGLRAAIEAHEREADVLVVCKSPAGYNNATVVAGGGFRAAMGGLTPEEHLEDTLRVGNHLNDRGLVEVFAREGGMRVLELKRFGVEMRVRRGGISVGDTPGLMGLGMTKPMVEHLREAGVRILENIVVTRLLKSGDVVVGAVGYDAKNGEPCVFSFKAVVLATGGAGALYERTDNPRRVTGDGYSLAFHVGASLRDMEFTQFYPLALAEPGHPPYLLGGPMSEEGMILNRYGEDIPEKHGVTARPLVLKSRGPLSVAIMREILGGNGVDGAVILDATEIFRTQKDEDWFSTGRYIYFRDKLKAAERPFRAAPISHFNMGGVIADEDGRTGVEGLYAAGEVVGGVHGANRHGGNALTDITVFGARAGAEAAAYAKSRERVNIDGLTESEIERYSSIPRDGSDPLGIMTALKKLMWVKVGPVRTEESLKEALEGIKELKEKAKNVAAGTARETLVALEVPLALDAAGLIIRAALERTESRGAHFREDYPKEDDSWLKTVILWKGKDGEINVSTRPL
jgi:succinate dehydrogenase/fumarate reductase flavoprotein subunit